MIKFNDDYQTKTCDVFGDGQTWEFAQFEHTILQNRRHQLGMTQQQVADAAQIQLRQYQRFESGERSLSSSSLRIGLAVCYVLRLDPYRFSPGFVLTSQSV